MTHTKLLIKLRATAQQRAKEQGISYNRYLLNMAEKSGIKTTNIYRTLSRKHMPTIERFCLLADLVGLEVTLNNLKNKKP